MGFTRDQVAKQCRKYGPLLEPLPPGIDGAQLLWALSGCESTFGENVTPRHESAYDYGGEYANKEPMSDLLELYGSGAAYSHGPWQILFVNAHDNFTPDDLNDIDNAAWASATFLNSLLRRFHPQTLEEIASCWNAGHIQRDPHTQRMVLSSPVARYAEDLKNFYAVPMPQTA